MKDLSSKELLYHPEFTYDEKYKIAKVLKILNYLPPENKCCLNDIPLEIFELICNYASDNNIFNHGSSNSNTICNFKQTCTYYTELLNNYQSNAKEITFGIYNGYINPYHKIVSLKKYYTGIKKLTINYAYADSSTSLKELLSWEGIKTLIFNAYEYRVDFESVTCHAETLIGNWDVSYITRSMKMPNLKQFILSEKINNCKKYICDELPGLFLKNISKIVNRSPIIKLFSYSVNLKNQNELDKYMSGINSKYHKSITKNVKYLIKSQEFVKKYDDYMKCDNNYFLVEIEGIVQDFDK